MAARTSPESLDAAPDRLLAGSGASGRPDPTLRLRRHPPAGLGAAGPPPAHAGQAQPGLGHRQRAQQLLLLLGRDHTGQTLLSPAAGLVGRLLADLLGALGHV